MFETSKQERLPDPKKAKPVAWVNEYVWDQQGVINHQLKGFHMWMEEGGIAFEPTATCIDNLASNSCLQLFVDLSGNRVVKKKFVEPILPPPVDTLPPNWNEIREKMLLIEKREPLEKMDAEEREFLWSHRMLVKHVPDLLTRLLLCVKWDQNLQVQEIYQLLQHWPEISAKVVLQLLSSRFCDPILSQFACKHLEKYISKFPNFF